MTTIEVYDPPMCCSSGVCGPEPDERLAKFSADLEWLKSRGAQVRRFNLTQEPLAFTQQPKVQQIINERGEAGLPVILIGGQVVSQGLYPSREQLAQWSGLNGEAPAGQDGEGVPVFDDRVAELIAIGAAVAVNCESCLEYHYDKAEQLNIPRQDIIRAVNVALKVKEQPAQSIVRLAQRLLVPESAESGGCCGGGSSQSGGCC